MDLKFDEKGLIPAIVQDHYTKEVLTLAYMNAETLALTIAEGRTVFWSRSRQEIWRTGETSGNVQRVSQGLIHQGLSPLMFMPLIFPFAMVSSSLMS